jgi:protocatechuate 3,4-dioxygenase beta subunit
MDAHRRRIVRTGAAAAAGLAAFIASPALASSRRALAAMTDGPFYPARAWRERWTDWDADLTTVQRDGRTRLARGEHLGLEAVVADTQGRLIDGAEVEIWQCDVMAAYRHAGVSADPGRHDDGFQGFGAGDPGNARDFLWRQVAPLDRPALEMALQPAPAASGLRWLVRHTLVVPG